MKKIFLTISLLILTLSLMFAQGFIRINQMGYLPGSVKAAVYISKTPKMFEYFELKDALTDKVIYKSENLRQHGNYYELKDTWRLDFSDFNDEGAYYIQLGETKSPNFKISKNVYNGAADFLLNYMRSRRCGYNPYFCDSCHTHDGYVIYHPTKEGKHIDVTGGWHDASDYLQYVTTSANATFQLLFAYEQCPGSFGDEYLANGKKGKNGIPDVLDEAKWGLDWLAKMNPTKNEMYHQIADDRDHKIFTFPNLDTVDYGYGQGKGRPVYFCTGKPQGLKKYQNTSDGLANIAGKYASAFALGSVLLEKYYPKFSIKIRQKAIDAYEWGQKNQGVCQTAPCTAPYYYEESNWLDDMELAAVQMYLLTKKEKYLNEAVEYGKQEPVTPWIAMDSVRHYQYYPFINLGHYYLSGNENSEIKHLFLKNMKAGIGATQRKGQNNAFYHGVPFIWCSNNLVTAMATQVHLYYKVKPGLLFAKTEAAMRDWLFGCNPWGTSMIVGLPAYGDYPDDTHAAISRFSSNEPWGGLVDGPVYASIFNSLKGVHLTREDPYAEFQTSHVVYHDDWADYSTNEPTMDGTASLVYYLAALEEEGKGDKENRHIIKSLGGIIRGDTTQKKIALVFTAHDRAEGYNIVKTALDKHKIKASFFLTGGCYRDSRFTKMIRTLKEEGHYLGGHSDNHILYASWKKRDSLLVTKEEFKKDLKANYLEMEKFGIKKEDAPYYMPSYEWYNQKISDWTAEMGLQLINHSPGTDSNQDWTLPDMGTLYRSNERIWKNIKNYEKFNGMNGFILLTHIGTDPKRIEKFYNELDELIEYLKSKGYQFVKIDEVINSPEKKQGR